MSKNVTVELPVTLRVSIELPDQVSSVEQGAKPLAVWFASKVLHVSHAQMDACNELNRVFHHAQGIVTDMEAELDA
jgi:hypothetical protein